MNTEYLLNKINANIKQNANGEITAEILNKILRDLLIYLDEKIGDLNYLNASINNDSLVDVVNLLQTQIESNKTGIHIGSGNPNENPPDSYATLDYYLQTDQNGQTLYLWQYTEKEWCKIANYIDDNAPANQHSTWSSYEIDLRISHTDIQLQEQIDDLNGEVRNLQTQINNLQDIER